MARDGASAPQGGGGNMYLYIYIYIYIYTIYLHIIERKDNVVLVLILKASVRVQV